MTLKASKLELLCEVWDSGQTECRDKLNESDKGEKYSEADLNAFRNSKGRCVEAKHKVKVERLKSV
jgi:hypothetical protein